VRKWQSALRWKPLQFVAFLSAAGRYRDTLLIRTVTGNVAFGDIRPVVGAGRTDP
jgi:hypothetical protein